MNRIKLLRKENSLTQKDLADKLNVSARSVGFYESGERDPDTETIKSLAGIFNVSSDYLLGLSDVKNANYSSINSAFHIDGTESLTKEDLQIVKDLVESLKKRHHSK